MSARRSGGVKRTISSGVSNSMLPSLRRRGRGSKALRKTACYCTRFKSIWACTGLSPGSMNVQSSK
jgi:hypothetical protein